MNSNNNYQLFFSNTNTTNDSNKAHTASPDPVNYGPSTTNPTIAANFLPQDFRKANSKACRASHKNLSPISSKIFRPSEVLQFTQYTVVTQLPPVFSFQVHAGIAQSAAQKLSRIVLLSLSRARDTVIGKRYSL